MKKATKLGARNARRSSDPGVRAEYDFTGAVRGKYVARYPGHAAALFRQAQVAADLSPRDRRLWLDDLRAAYAGDPRQAAILAAVELLWAAQAQQETVRKALELAFGDTAPVRHRRGRQAV
jgi:hypothetical protein